MSRWNDDDAPETFRDAFESGRILQWLRSQIVWGGGFLVLLGLAYVYFQIFPLAHEKPKIDVADATTHAQAMWRQGDQAGAIRYYLDVAAQGAPEAEYTMGVLYESAKGKLHNDGEAAKWFQKASDKNYAAAERELALLNHSGEGVAKSDAKALKLFRAAAEAGNADAETDLAQSYEDGTLGLGRNPAQAVAWYGRAAAQGSVVAQVNLSNQLFKGAAGTPDAPGAYRWASVATAHSQPGTAAYRVASGNVATARARMTPGQIAEADAWVKSWKAQSP